MKAYDTYIFDLDGTLLDTLSDLAKSVNHALAKNGLPLRTKDEIRSFLGNGVVRLIESSVPDGTSPKVTEATLADFRSYYLEHSLDETRPFPGITDMLRSLRARGKNIAIVSNKFYTATQELARYFFHDIIDVAIGEHESEGIKRKPAPDTILEAFRQLDVVRDNAVYVGDSEVDILTAKNSGLPCISVLWGFRDKAFLEEHGATFFAETPQDLLG